MTSEYGKVLAWLLSHGIKTAWVKNALQLLGCELEVDETNIGGRKRTGTRTNSLMLVAAG